MDEYIHGILLGDADMIGSPAKTAYIHGICGLNDMAATGPAAAAVLVVRPRTHELAA